ncbi:hypothetical protein AAFH68_16650 [Flavobacterium sp. CGRL1]
MAIDLELKKFEEKVKDIFFYTSRYGLSKMFKDGDSQAHFNPADLNRLCFEGFKIAQSKILIELRDLEQKTKQLSENIKESRRNRDKTLEKKLAEEKTILNYHSSIFRNFADTIAWQLLNGEHYLYRRLCTGETGEKGLLEKSFDFVIDFAQKINEDPDSFCLITDLTNNIQLGDCLIVDKEGVKISEIKSGETNFKALEVIKDQKLAEDNFNEEDIKKQFDDKFVKQLKRMLLQRGKTQRAATIVQEHRGKDPKYKETIVNIVENDFELQTYHSTIYRLLNKLEESDWAYESVEAIVHIGVYKDDWRFYGQTAMKSLCAPYPFMDLMSGRGINISEPVFLKPFTDQQIIDIVLGRIKIFIGIDFDKLIELSNDLGIKASWSTTKELQNFVAKAKYYSKEFFSFNNKGIKVKIDGKEILLGHGFFSKITFDHFLPSTMLLKYQNTLHNLDFETDEEKLS